MNPQRLKPQGLGLHKETFRIYYVKGVRICRLFTHLSLLENIHSESKYSLLYSGFKISGHATKQGRQFYAGLTHLLVKCQTIPVPKSSEFFN